MGIALIYCASGNATFAQIAVTAGWLYGARLPATVYQVVHFADQDWKQPNRTAYMRALAHHRPALATVIDWEHDEQLPEVLSWAEEVAQHVTESVLIVPKVCGGVSRLPRRIGGKRVVLAYSVPTSYGGSPLHLLELAGWPVHLLGGSPHKQMGLWSYLRLVSDVISADGNMMAQQARCCRFWSPQRQAKGRWIQLAEAGDGRPTGAHTECFRRSSAAILTAWRQQEACYAQQPR